MRPASCHSASLPSALNSLVAILVVLLKVFEKVLVLPRHLAVLREPHEHVREFLQCLFVKVVLVCLHIAKLRKGLVAIIEPADKGLQAFVCLFMRAEVSTLSEALATCSAREWFFTRVTPYVSLEISSLRKRKATVFHGADIWSMAGVSASMNVAMRLLDKGFAAVWAIANPLFSRLPVLGTKYGSACGTVLGCPRRCKGLLALLGRLCLLDDSHELINFSPEADPIARMNRLIISESLGADKLGRSLGIRRAGALGIGT